MIDEIVIYAIAACYAAIGTLALWFWFTVAARFCSWVSFRTGLFFARLKGREQQYREEYALKALKRALRRGESDTDVDVGVEP